MKSKWTAQPLGACPPLLPSPTGSSEEPCEVHVAVCLLIACLFESVCTVGTLGLWSQEGQKSQLGCGGPWRLTRTGPGPAQGPAQRSGPASCE